MRARFLAVLTVGLGVARGALAAGSAVVALHLGDVDPQTEGFTWEALGSEGLALQFIDEFGFRPDLVLYPVWAVRDPIPFASVRYRYDPTPDEVANALVAGFTVRWAFRILPQLGDVDPSAGLAALRFGPPYSPSFGLDLLFGATSAQAGANLRMLAPDAPPELVLPGGSVHRLVEASYDPVSESFDVFVDGALVFADLAEPFIPTASAFSFGAAEASAVGRIHHLYAELEINLPDCSDGLDNDGDGFADLVDPGCSAGDDLSEEDSVGCNDDQDNDADGLIDLADPGCAGPGDEIEFDFGPGASSWLVHLSLGLEQQPFFVPPQAIAETGVARVEQAPGGTRYLGLPRIAGVSTAVLTGSPMAAILSASASGTFAIATDGPTNALPVHGQRRLCFINPDCSIASLDTPFEPTTKAVMGVGGEWDPQFTSSANFMMNFAAWTLGTASALVDTGPQTVTSTRMGFVHGPLSATSTLSATSGVVQLVTPTRISQTGLSPSQIAWFTHLEVRFVPEPASAIAFGIGAGVLLALARRRAALAGMRSRIAACLALLLAAPSAHASGSSVVASYTGDTNPQLQGWLLQVNGDWIQAFNNISATGIADDLGFPVWAIDDGTPLAGVYYEAPIAYQEAANAKAAGFAVRARLRVLPQAAPIDPVDGLAGILLGDGGNGYELRLGANADTPGNGNLRILAVDGPAELEIAGGAVHHLIEIVYDPTAATVAVFVDGVERISDWASQSPPHQFEFRPAIFGSPPPGFTSISATGEVRIHHVEVEINIPDCDDGLDDDGDGLVDLADPGCLALEGTS